MLVINFLSYFIFINTFYLLVNWDWKKLPAIGRPSLYVSMNFLVLNPQRFMSSDTGSFDSCLKTKKIYRWRPVRIGGPDPLYGTMVLPVEMSLPLIFTTIQWLISLKNGNILDGASGSTMRRVYKESFSAGQESVVGASFTWAGVSTLPLYTWCSGEYLTLNLMQNKGKLNVIQNKPFNTHFKYLLGHFIQDIWHYLFSLHGQHSSLRALV